MIGKRLPVIFGFPLHTRGVFTYQDKKDKKDVFRQKGRNGSLSYKKEK